MGRGRSKAGGGGQSGRGGTPSGITYDEFLKLDEGERYRVMTDIANDPNIRVPDYLDSSITTKVLYGLGMDNRMTVVSEDALDNMPGKDLYRTVYEGGSMPPPSSEDVLDQIRNGDYTQMSGSGGSAHGRAIYFARDDFDDSAWYGSGERNALMMRAKLNPDAKIMRETSIIHALAQDQHVKNGNFPTIEDSDDAPALWAIAHGVDGWYSRNYTMMINRGKMTASTQNKRITSMQGGRRIDNGDWQSSPNA